MTIFQFMDGPSSSFASTGAMFFGISGAAGAPDYGATVGVNAPFPIPQDGATFGAGAPTRFSASSFLINQTGIYKISYQASVTESGQLALRKNAVADAFRDRTRAGRATGSSLITNVVFVSLVATDQIALYNDASAAALTVTPNAGGTNAVSVTLTIMRVG